MRPLDVWQCAFLLCALLLLSFAVADKHNDVSFPLLSRDASHPTLHVRFDSGVSPWTRFYAVVPFSSLGLGLAPSRVNVLTNVDRSTFVPNPIGKALASGRG